MARRSSSRYAVPAAVLLVIGAVAIAWPNLRSRAAAAAGERGMAAHANLHYDDALAEYQLASSRDQVDWRWTYYRALIHLDRGEAAQAAAALRAVVNAKPDLALAWWRLGEAEFKQAHYDGADAAYARAEADAALSAHARFGRGRVAQARGGPTAAQRAYAAPRDPMVDALARISANSLFLLKHAASPGIARDSAFREELTRRALEVDPDNPDVVYEMGALLQRLRRPAEALPYFVRHLDMVDDDRQTLVQVGKCYSDLGRLDEAESTLRWAVALADDAVGFYNLGFVLEQRDRADEAERFYRRAVELDAGLASARNNLGALLAREGRLADAAVHLAEAIRLDPSKPDAYTNLSAVRLQEGAAAEAAKLARLALDVDPRHADAHVNLGVALARLGDLAEARRQFDEALRIDPRHAGARANRQALGPQP